MIGERLGEPAASDLLGRAIVVCRHHGVGPSIVSEGRGGVGGEILDPNRIVAAGEGGEAGENKRAHLIGPLVTPTLSSLFLHLEASIPRDLRSFCRALDGCSPRAAALEALSWCRVNYPQ
jgi:hypothetical protein